ncbi:transposase [Micromonospora globispora]|uniref:transposase n=1 Tax=Micromonospora globispora TaxID=1450148 RepID=UPI003C6D80C0
MAPIAGAARATSAERSSGPPRGAASCSQRTAAPASTTRPPHVSPTVEVRGRPCHHVSGRNVVPQDSLRLDIGPEEGVSPLGRPSKYMEEFRRDAVDLVRSSQRPINQVARELGMSHETLRNWVRVAERQARDVCGGLGRGRVVGPTMSQPGPDLPARGRA